jgi:hypothetical protein
MPAAQARGTVTHFESALVAALFENLEDGVSLAEFVELFPGVTQVQARLVLEQVGR